LTPANLTELGRVLKPHGLKGAVKVRVTASGVPIIEKDEPVFILVQGGPVPFFSEEKATLVGNALVLKLEGIDTMEQAEQLVGKQLLVDPEMIEDEEQEGLYALIGLKVQDINLGEIGTVTGIMEVPQQSVLEVEHQGKQILIPAVEGIIIGLDQKTGVISVDTPPGLVDLYLNG
jgi:16S rRNA processing protein RimM